MTEMMRHVGKLKQTDTRCVVVMMQIPGREDHALIVESDSLPDHYHQNVMNILESKEGQANINFGDELGRRQMFIADRGNMSVMQALHEARFLRAVHIDSVVMTPVPGSAYPLRQVLEGMNAPLPGEKTMLDPANDPNATKFNPHQHNQEAKSSEDKISQAQGILTQADFLQAEANAKREEAYRIAPELRPQTQAKVAAQPADIAPTAETIPVEAPKKRGRGRPKGSTKAKKASNS